MSNFVSPPNRGVIAFYPISTAGTTAWSTNSNRCNVCHSSGGGTDLNPYGRAWAAEHNTGISTEQAFTNVQSLNSDGNAGGATNLTEIIGNAQPGWTTGTIQLYDINALTPTVTTTSPPPGLVGPLDPAPTTTTTTTTTTTAATTTTTVRPTTTTTRRTTTTTTRRATTTTASTTTTTLPSLGAALYSYCADCHDGAALGGGGRNVAGARTCSIDGSINGTSVFPGGVPAMRFLKGLLSPEDIQAISDSLNSNPATGQQRYITACAGCHGADGRGGRVHENARGSAGEILEAIDEERPMRFLGCLPASDIKEIGNYLKGKKRGDGRGDRDDD